MKLTAATAAQWPETKLTDLCQCLMIASVLSTMVPSRSSRTPVNECLSIGAVNVALITSCSDRSMTKNVVEQNDCYVEWRLDFAN